MILYVRNFYAINRINELNNSFTMEAINNAVKISKQSVKLHS